MQGDMGEGSELRAFINIVNFSYSFDRDTNLNACWMMKPTTIIIMNVM